MGKKSKRRNKNKDLRIGNEEFENLDVVERLDVKGKSKFSKKLRKRLLKEQQNSSKYKRNTNKEIDVDGRSKSKSSWHKIMITSECPVDRQFLLSSIGAYVDDPFIPLGYHRVGSDTIFYLEGSEEAAMAIGSLDKRIQDPEKELMRILVCNSKIPDLVLNLDQLVVLKDVLSHRYDASLSLLDLSNLHLDATLVGKDILVPLANPLIMKQVIKIIKEYAPTTKALNLSKNNLNMQCIELLQNIMDTSLLSALNLEGNPLDSFKILKFIKVFPLLELNLGVVSKMENKLDFVKKVRKELPTLQKLDGIAIDSFVEQHQGHFKILKSSLLGTNDSASTSTFGNVNQNVMLVSEENLKNFLEQYYSVTDTPERSNLLPAYTPSATVDLKSNCVGISSLVFNGPVEIGRFLSEFPATKHLHPSFDLSFTKIEPQEGIVQVKGQCFIHGLPENEPINFKRTLNIIPYNAGLCCSFDIYEIS